MATIGSIETPIWATWDIFPTPNIPKLLFSNSWFFFNVDILNIADGLAFEMYPRNCQFGGAVGSGQLKYTTRIYFEQKYNEICNIATLKHIPAPPMPLGNGIVPVRNTTIWFMSSASGTVIRNWFSPICWKSVCTYVQIIRYYTAVIVRFVHCYLLKVEFDDLDYHRMILTSRPDTIMPSIFAQSLDHSSFLHLLGRTKRILG